jgi:cold shock protein
MLVKVPASPNMSRMFATRVRRATGKVEIILHPFWVMELRRRQRDRNHARGDRAAWSDAPTLDPGDRLPEDILVGDRGSQIPSGTVKWFNAPKDVFVHISAVERSGLGGLNEGQKLAYEGLKPAGNRGSRQRSTSKLSETRRQQFATGVADAIGLRQQCSKLRHPVISHATGRHKSRAHQPVPSVPTLEVKGHRPGLVLNHPVCNP